MTSTETMQAPQAATKFIADAEAAGFTVTTEALAEDYSVTVERGDEASGYASWRVENVAPVNSRLGFHTEYAAGVRFNYGSTAKRSYLDEGRMKYGEHRSLRQVRIALGIAV